MALFFSVFVLVLAQQVFANPCPLDEDLIELTTCDECIRCAGIWCNKPDENGVQCNQNKVYNIKDPFCPNNRAELLTVEPICRSGTQVEPNYLERSVRVGQEDFFKLTFNHNLGSNDMPNIELTTTSTRLHSEYIQRTVVPDLECKEGKCSVTIRVRPTINVCPVNGTNKEFFELRVKIEGISEEVTAKYHIPCACECSLKKPEENSSRCSGNGDYLGCGTCICKNGWKGNRCEEGPFRRRRPTRLASKPDCDRGDTPVECFSNDLVCSNHGTCNCGTCECFTDTGVNFFGKYCEDVCQYTANNCDSCMLMPTAGLCNECPIFNLIVENANKTLLKEYDWTKCNLTENDCYVEYVARSDESDNIYVMVTRSCNGVATTLAGAPINVTVPVILGVIAVIAAATAVAGYMVWKSRTPPVPLTDPKYENIDAEDCTGINPLYKPPTSSFKNPQYGNKW